jgi:hypothetical protein
VVGQVVVVHGIASIEGVARGDVVVFSGRAIIAGQVSGDVVVLDGTIVLGPTAQVRGSVIGRGDVLVRKGAQVQGEIRSDVPLSLSQPARLFGMFATWLAVSVSTLLLGLLLLWLAPRGAESVSSSARRAPWASAGWGVGLFVAIPALCLAAVASLVALPLGLVAFLGLGLVLSMGYAWSAWILGRRLLPDKGRVVAFLAGLAIIRVFGIVPVVGGITWILGAAFGLGAMTVAIWSVRGTRGKHRAGRAAPATWQQAPQASLPPELSIGAEDSAVTMSEESSEPAEPERPSEPEEAEPDREGSSAPEPPVPEPGEASAEPVQSPGS